MVIARCFQKHYVSSVMAVLLLAGVSAWTAPPETVNVHGLFMDAEGFPLSGERVCVVRFFDAIVDGVQLGDEVNGLVEVSPEGMFNLPVALPPEALAAPELWYELGIDTDTPPDGDAEDDLFPERIRVHSVPFALEAGTAAHVENVYTKDEVDASQAAQDAAITLKANAADVYTKGEVDTSQDAQDAVIALKADAADVYTRDEVDVSQAAQDAAIALKADLSSVYIQAEIDASQAEQDAVIALKADADDVYAKTETYSSAETDALLLEKLGYSGESYIIVKTTDNEITNGNNLRAAYGAAKALTPHGMALSATNRVVVLVPPGNYDLDASEFTLDTDFVDLIGLSTRREDQRIHRSGGHVLMQTALDVGIENLLLHYTGVSDITNAYYPNAIWNSGANTGSPPGTIIRNCAFHVNGTTYRSMRTGVEYAGAYEDCTASGGYAFGGLFGTASGTFTNCTGGDYAFGSIGGTASGTFTNCTGGLSAFGGYSGTVSGTFTNCTGGDYAFGGRFGTASGTFTNCTGGTYAFGGDGGWASGTFTNCTGGDGVFGCFGTASGTFTNCTGGDGVFGGFGTASGTFTNCTGGDTAFGGFGTADGGKFYFCVGGSSSFTTDGSPTVIHCVRNGVAYP